MFWNLENHLCHGNCFKLENSELEMPSAVRQKAKERGVSNWRQGALKAGMQNMGLKTRLWDRKSCKRNSASTAPELLLIRGKCGGYFWRGFITVLEFGESKCIWICGVELLCWNLRVIGKPSHWRRLPLCLAWEKLAARFTKPAFGDWWAVS